MTLGAVWSYAEQGWGGYWAWDPVENTSLLVWLAALVALHAAPGSPHADRYVVAPWVVAVFGAALNRSGATPSVHSFAEQAAVGWWLSGIGVATAVAAVALVRRRRRRGAVRTRSTLVATVLHRRRRTARRRRRARAAAHRPARPTDPTPSAASSTAGPSVRWHCWLCPLLVRHVRRRRGWTAVAHAGTLVFLAGIGATTFDRVDTVPVAADATIDAAGVAVTNHGVDVVPGPRDDADSVVASLTVGGHHMSPSLVVYRANGGRLAESDLDPGLVYDTQVLLDDADDAGGVIVTVYRRPFVWLVWLGAALITVGTLGAAVRRRTPTRDPSRGRNHRQPNRGDTAYPEWSHAYRRPRQPSGRAPAGQRPVLVRQRPQVQALPQAHRGSRAARRGLADAVRARRTSDGRRTPTPASRSSWDEPRVKSPEIIERMRHAGTVAAEILVARRRVRASPASPPTRSTSTCTACTSSATPTRRRSTTTAIPKSVCTSVNEVICHGIPDSRRLARRRHHQPRRHRLHRRRPRRHQRHVLRRRRRPGEQGAGQGHRRVHVARHRGRAAGPAGERHRQGDRGPRQGAPLRRGARRSSVTASASSSTPTSRSCTTTTRGRPR